MVDDDERRTDDGRTDGRRTDTGAWVYYKLTCEPSAQVSQKWIWIRCHEGSVLQFFLFPMFFMYGEPLGENANAVRVCMMKA